MKIYDYHYGMCEKKGLNLLVIHTVHNMAGIGCERREKGDYVFAVLLVAVGARPNAGLAVRPSRILGGGYGLHTLHPIARRSSSHSGKYLGKAPVIEKFQIVRHCIILYDFPTTSWPSYWVFNLIVLDRLWFVELCSFWVFSSARQPMPVSAR